MFEKQIQIEIGQNPGKSTSDDRARYVSQSIRRGRISREGALHVRESRERRDKIGQKPGNLHRLFWFPIAIARAWSN